jgi:hypothetical protein
MNVQAHATSSSQLSREIDGKGRTIRELLAGRKYSIDYYQREKAACRLSRIRNSREPISTPDSISINSWLIGSGALTDLPRKLTRRR